MGRGFTDFSGLGWGYLRNLSRKIGIVRVLEKRSECGESRDNGTGAARL